MSLSGRMRVVQGDITRLDVDAIANAANESGSGTVCPNPEDAMFRRTCILFGLCLVLSGAPMWAFPGYPAPDSPTLTDEINVAHVAVIARRVGTKDSGRYEVLHVLKGGEHIKGMKHIDVPNAAQAPAGTLFLLLGNKPPKNDWNVR